MRGAPSDRNLAWNVYGAGLDGIGLDGRPELVAVPEPAPDQLLVRVDAVGLCFSDVKLIRQGGDHPKLYGRDLASDPTRLGHEATVTVTEVGEDLRDRYRVGDRLAVQPDIYVDGRSNAYGYTIPGGLIRYHLMGSEVLDAADGAYVISVEDEAGYAAAALSEPWACVEAAYTQRRRLEPKPGGIMWIIGSEGDTTSYEFGRGLGSASTIVLTDVSPTVVELVEAERDPSAVVLVEDGATAGDIEEFVAEMTGGEGFDDVVMLAPSSPDVVAAVARSVAFRGTLNLVSDRPLEGDVDIDLGRIHYHYVAYVGSRGPDIAASYGPDRNRCELRPGGVAVFVGGAGPMGQMHIQRALQSPRGPTTLIASDFDATRRRRLRERMEVLAKEAGRTLLIVDPAEEDLGEIVRDASGGAGADDVVVLVPNADAMSEGARLLGPDGMLVLFAGVPVGTLAPLDLSAVFIGNAQFTGTSGSTLADQTRVLEKAGAGELEPERSLAAVASMEYARDGIEALVEGRFAGKIVIYPQLQGLPLLALEDLAEKHPEIGRHLADDRSWTSAAEAALIEAFADG